MKNRFVKLLSIVLVFALIISASAFAGSAAAEDEKLRFNEDGKFTIMQIADTQDTLFPRAALIEFIGRALDEVQPDLVVFTGDNTEDFTFLTLSWKPAIDWIVKPLADRDIPFTLVFGNHDALIPAGKETLFKTYLSYDNCLAYDADPDTAGTGNHNLPIYASNGDDVKFNLWMLDSHGYDFANFAFDFSSLSNLGAMDDIVAAAQSVLNIPYGYVKEDQMNWFNKTNDALTAQAGQKVPSLVFQHIIVPEVSELLVEAGEGYSGATKKINGKVCTLALNDKATGALGEFPCPPTHNGGEFEALKASGSVLGIVTGHDHVNDFIGTVDGIDLIQTSGIGHASYGDDEVRGVRIITLDEANPDSYETSSLLYSDVFATEEDSARYSFSKGIGGAFVTFLASVASLFGLDKIEVMMELISRLA